MFQASKQIKSPPRSDGLFTFHRKAKSGDGGLLRGSLVSSLHFGVSRAQLLNGHIEVAALALQQRNLVKNLSRRQSQAR